MHTHKQKLVYCNNATAVAVALMFCLRKTNLKLVSGVLDISLCCRKTCDRHSER